jgi:hypothetical protein
VLVGEGDVHDVAVVRLDHRALDPDAPPGVASGGEVDRRPVADHLVGSGVVEDEDLAVASFSALSEKATAERTCSDRSGDATLPASQVRCRRLAAPRVTRTERWGGQRVRTS